MLIYAISLCLPMVLYFSIFLKQFSFKENIKLLFIIFVSILNTILFYKKFGDILDSKIVLDKLINNN